MNSQSALLAGERSVFLGPGLVANGWAGFATLKTWVSEADGKAAQEKVLTDLGVKSGNADASGTAKAEIFYDGSNGSTINAGGGNDIVFGGGGHDTLNGGSGDDMLHGEGLKMPPLWALRRKLESSPSSFRRRPESRKSAAGVLVRTPAFPGSRLTY